MLSLELYFINQCENRIKAFSEMSEDKVFCYVLLFKGLLKDFFQKIECIKDYICDPRTVDPQEREREKPSGVIWVTGERASITV